MAEEKAKLEHLRLEYSEVNANRRHYSNLRFAGFSVYFAVLAGLASVAFGMVDIRSAEAKVILGAKIAGLFFTIIFFWFEILGDLNIRHLGKVAKELEELLGYRQFKTKNFRGPSISAGACMAVSYYFGWSQS